MANVLCHACCAVCAGYSLEKLKSLGYQPTVLFFNPNIYPKDEHDRRLRELERFCQKYDYPLIVRQDGVNEWYKIVDGLENEPEKGKRCELCFYNRLSVTAQIARELGYPFITTTLTISPHKNSKQIFSILERIKDETDVDYLKTDLKKENGFLKTMEIAKSENFYRQTYCGCEFSIRK